MSVLSVGRWGKGRVKYDKALEEENERLKSVIGND
jgi:hypothetical protein